MTPSPTPTQIAEWREKFESKYTSEELFFQCGEYSDRYIQHEWQGYLRARTEQATEIAELKAKLAGAEAEIAALKQGLHRADEKLAALMSLAKFGAMFLRELEPDYSEVVTEFFLNTGVLDTASEYAPKIKATIEQLLKD
jgi:chromosome segregation ATPase